MKIWAEKWVKEIIGDCCDYLEVTRSANEYFKWDPAGNECVPLFDVDKYAFVFIHHSQKGDSLIPSTVIDLIKQILGEKLVLFSGNIDEHFINCENRDYIFRSIKRNKLRTKLKGFILHSIRLKEWVIEILFYDYENLLISKIMTMQDDQVSNDLIIGSLEFKRFLCIKNVIPDSSEYKKIMLLDEYKLIEELRNL